MRMVENIFLYWNDDENKVTLFSNGLRLHADQFDKFGFALIITLRQKIICSVADPSVHIMHYAMCYVEICDHKNHA